MSERPESPAAQDRPSFDECGFRPADTPCECGFEDESSAATVIEGLLKRLYELDADDHPAEEAARAYLAQRSPDAKELPTPDEVRGILPKPPPGGWPA